MDKEREQVVVGALGAMGDPRAMLRWRRGEPDYVAAVGLTEADVPVLLATARRWLERENWPKDKDDLSIYAPIHAWRALGQLRASAAVGTLLGLLDGLDDADDDWYLEEMPEVFGLIGPAALAELATYLADDGHRLFPRICVANGHCCVGQRYRRRAKRCWRS